ncbi:hypothetical protein H2200_013369 [Cladophialophora chaetospira]|uniref:Xylanolytic transcriptional activator regulatory domain-containing protein n=1 Tax=Cladophialophora chaetospira TaxID=386627 RepID=A0AA38WW64_9EURO|nr:hypothetical protein H2200_013369 [Cladophialophora chaetospira]
MDTYFQATHWFLFLLHEPSFRSRAAELLSTPTWENQDLGEVLLLLMVAAFGAQYYAQTDDNSRLSLDVPALQASFISAVRANLLQTLVIPQTSTVQICLLLGTYYIYHGSPNLAWSILGLAAKVAYSLSLHQDVDVVHDPITTQIRRRVWGHVKISDTFTAMIYGRPASVNQELSETKPPEDCDDTIIPFPLSADPAFIWGNKRISKVTFHLFRYQLYDIIAQALHSFQLLRLQHPLSTGNVTSLINQVGSLESSLNQWYDSLPPLYKTVNWERGKEPFQSTNLPPEQESLKHILKMQALLLQLTYDNAMILVHRPLLEYRIASDPTSKRRPGRYDPFSRSLDICFRAALRTSNISVSPFKNVYPSGFMSMHLLTAGVILCLLPTSEPFGKRAQEAKSGILRLIRSSKALAERSKIASQGHQLLATLMKAVLQSEFECALTSEDQVEDENVDAADILSNGTQPLGSTSTPQHNLGHAQQLAPQFQDDLLSDSIDMTTSGPFQTPHSDINFELNQDMNNAFDSLGRAMFSFQESENMPYSMESLWQPYIFDPLQNNSTDTMNRWEGAQNQAQLPG